MSKKPPKQKCFLVRFSSTKQCPHMNADWLDPRCGVTWKPCHPGRAFPRSCPLADGREEVGSIELEREREKSKRTSLDVLSEIKAHTAELQSMLEGTKKAKARRPKEQRAHERL